MTRKRHTWPLYIYVGIVWVLAIYVGFAGLIFSDLFRVDFSSLYSSINALCDGINPYQVLKTDYLDVVKILPANLNPPIIMLTFLPLHFLSYHTAMAIWLLILLVCLFANFYLAGRYGCSQPFWQRYQGAFLLIYLTLFSTIMGMAIAQLGAFIAFWILLGFHFYQNKAYHRCALCWGYITACKFFPAVLLLFCLQQRHYRLAFYCILYGLLFTLLPALLFGFKLYANYYDMMSRVMWYGDSWNASFFGIVGRLLIDTTNIYVDLWPYHIIWLAIAAPVLLYYLSRRHLESKFSFILALVLMLILSPFGWMYYFPLLLIAMLYTAEKAEKGGYIWLWFIVLVMMNLPVDYIQEKDQGDILLRLSLFSVHFYGLILLLSLLYKRPNSQQLQDFSSIRLPIALNQGLGMIIVSLIIIYHYLYFK